MAHAERSGGLLPSPGSLLSSLGSRAIILRSLLISKISRVVLKREKKNLKCLKSQSKGFFLLVLQLNSICSLDSWTESIFYFCRQSHILIWFIKWNFSDCSWTRLECGESSSVKLFGQVKEIIPVQLHKVCVVVLNLKLSLVDVTLKATTVSVVSSCSMDPSIWKDLMVNVF